VRGPCAAVAEVQSAVFGVLPGGAPGTVQPSSGSPSSSKEVEPAAPLTTTSSTAMPLNWKTASVT